MLCAIRHFLFLDFSYGDRKGWGRGNGDETREERSQTAPDEPGSRKWYKIMKRSNGTCWTSRDAVGRPRRRCRRSRTRANGSERNDPSKDEERSSAAVKRARHLSRTYVLLARLVHLLSYVPSDLISLLFLPFIRPVPYYSRILWFSPGNVYLKRDSTDSRQYLRTWDEILHSRECMLFQNALECKDRVKSLLPWLFSQLSSSLHEFHFSYVYVHILMCICICIFNFYFLILLKNVYIFIYLHYYIFLYLDLFNICFNKTF